MYLQIRVLILVLVEHTLRGFEAYVYDENIRVLILVLVEHTLRARQGIITLPQRECVLILVLVEHTLRAGISDANSKNKAVLILVLVEHTLREAGKRYAAIPHNCLNPCFSGTYSQSTFRANSSFLAECLNPCFSGTYSQRNIERPH